ncbi:MAG: tRNA-intron lyase [Candidatus Bathyarchaeia archaeon]
MSTVEVEAVLKDGRVVVPSQEEAEHLGQGGYGTPLEREAGSILNSYEALYLLAEKRAKVVNSEDGAEMDFQTLLERLRAYDDEAWTRYLIYRDLRSRGYVVRDGFGFGFDFRLYGRGEYGKKPAKYIVYGIREGKPTPLEQLSEILRFAQSVRKGLVIAVVDRRGEVVYYSISTLTF